MRELINCEVLGRTAVVREKKEDPQSLWYFFSLLGREAGKLAWNPRGGKLSEQNVFQP